MDAIASHGPELIGGHGSRRMPSRFEHEEAPTVTVTACRSRRQWLSLGPWILSALLLLLSSWSPTVWAMRPERIVQLRQETVEMFYHGFDNYMTIAFPEDEVCYTGHTILFSHPGLLTAFPLMQCANISIIHSCDQCLAHR
jgi:hypothetical protein